MPNVLEEKIREAALTFTYAVVRAVARASLTDIRSEADQAGEPRRLSRPSTPTKRGPGGPGRSVTRLEASARGTEAPVATVKARAESSADDISTTIILYLRSHPGATGESTRKILAVEKGRWNRIIARAIQGGRLRKEGTKRGTKYWAV
jgi:hypothetical protein